MLSSPVIIRTISAIALAPPLLLLLLAGSPRLLWLLALPAAALLVYEWHKLHEPFTWHRFLPLLLGVVGVLLTRFPATGSSAGAPWPSHPWLPDTILYGLLLLFFLVEGLWYYRPDRPVVADSSRRFLGVLYCAMPLAMLVEIRQAQQGEWLVCLLLLIIWATDIGAYFVGRRWGQRKLAPRISPGKTLAGFCGGVLLAGGVGGIAAYAFGLSFGWLVAILLGGVLAVVGQVGDLAESLLKREAGLKDSGQLIPGHGGLLDRLDSLLFAAPVFYLFLWIVS